MANKKHYYFSIEDYGKITDAPFEYYRNGYERDQTMKAIWAAHFKLYTETDRILERIKDPDCPLFPLYRGFGDDDEDYIFETREEAESEYEAHINMSIGDRMYNL